MRAFNILENESVCANCRHYYQHYTKLKEYGDSYISVNSGHCAYPRMKSRAPGCEACSRFDSK